MSLTTEWRQPAAVPQDKRVIELCSGTAVVTVDALSGGRIAQIEIDERPYLVDEEAEPIAWGCYPMVPWAGRVGNARFEFADRIHFLEADMPPNAIHGTGYKQTWTAIDRGLDYVDLSYELPWSLGGRAQQHLVLTDNELVCVLTVMATTQPMPATIGWHPWFRKPLRLHTDFAGMYARGDDGLPTGEIITPPPSPWDDCFVRSQHPPRLDYEHLTITVDSDCDHWVVYDMPDHATCVEPQSGPPDAFNLGAATVLQPGEILQRVMRIRWTPTAPAPTV
jgi:aldose 1-epimerase